MSLFKRAVFALTAIFSASAVTPSIVGDAKAEESTPAEKTGGANENLLYMQLKDGRVVIQLRPDLAPEHVKRIKELTREGFYDGVVFHRVIEGFMAQTGDPTGTGMGGSTKPNLKAEFNDTKHVRGTLSMARAQSPNSANSQFFICFKPAKFLDGQYTVFGQVIEGMEFVDAIKKGNPNDNGSVTRPDKIITMKLAEDAASVH
jgi:peptidylprolyl isomerase